MCTKNSGKGKGSKFSRSAPDPVDSDSDTLSSVDNEKCYKCNKEFPNVADAIGCDKLEVVPYVMRTGLYSGSYGGRVRCVRH